MVKKVLELLQNTNKKKFRIEKVIKKKEINYMSNGKVIIVYSIVRLIKKALYKVSQYFTNPYRSFRGNFKVELDLPSYVTKADLKNTAGVETSNFAAKSDLASLKTEKDKLDADNLKATPIDLSKLSNVVNNDVKKNVYNKLVARVNNIDSSGFVLKTKYNTDKSDSEKKLVIQTKKYLILVDLLKKEIIMLTSLQ